MFNELNSSEFIVTARKWRPLRFSDVAGQDHITTTLKNAISNNRIHHAYLFSGPRGVGKTTTARILARALNCTSPLDFEPCNKCETCMSITEGRSMDIIEIDGASNNSVDDIRKLRENAKYPPVIGKYKMYIIDEVHMLSTSAFNALLKTLEEPPPHLMFVFATTEPHKLPATILSRCQRYGFRRMEITTIVHQLSHIAKNESIEIDEESLITIAKKADGSMRDSQSIFDQVVAFCGKKIIYSELAEALHLIDQDFYFNISECIKNKNITKIFNVTKEIIQKGFDLQECLGGLLEHYRNIMTVKATGTTSLIESSSEFLERYEKVSKEYNKADLLRLMHIIASTEQSLKFSPNPRTRFETALVQMALLDSSIEVSELIKELKLFQKGTSSTGMANINARQPVSEVRPTSAPVRFESKSDEKYSDSKQVTHSAHKILVSSAKLETGWKEYLEKNANHSSGLYLLNQEDVVKPSFLNSEIILKIIGRFAHDSLTLKKAQIAETLSDFFKGDISVKIIQDDPISINEDNVESKKTPEQDFPPEQINEHIITLDEDIMKNKESEPVSSRHPVEQTIIELFKPKVVE